MRVMILLKATADSEQGFAAMPEPWRSEMMAAMGRFNAELRAAGILRDAGGLQPSAVGKRVWVDGPERTVSDGPFAPPGDLVSGFWLWEVRDMDEAVEWVRRCPSPLPGPSEIEIRPLYESGDLKTV